MIGIPKILYEQLPNYLRPFYFCLPLGFMK